MKCPKCKEGKLQYQKRGMIVETYKTNAKGEPVGNPIDTEKDFYFNPHHACDNCDYTYDLTDEEEIE